MTKSGEDYNKRESNIASIKNRKSIDQERVEVEVQETLGEDEVRK